MKEVWDVLWKALIVGGAGIIVTTVVFFIKWLISLSKILNEMKNNGLQRKNENASMIAIMKKLITSTTSILEILKEMGANGDTKKGLKCMDEANELYDDLLVDKVKGDV